MADKKISALTASTTPLAGTEVLPIVQSGTTVKVSVADLTAGRAVSMSDATLTGVYDQSAYAAFGWIGSWNNTGTSGHQMYFGYNNGTNNRIGLYIAGGPGTANQLDLTVANKFGVYGSGGVVVGTGDPGAGNLQISNGNIIPGTAAKGINFTANTPASGMTSQLLNWYEEGNFNVTATCDSGTITLNNKKLYYTRIGKLVTITGYIDVTSVSSPSGNVYFGNLPYAAVISSSTGLQANGLNAITGLIPVGVVQTSQSIIYIQMIEQSSGNLLGAASYFKAGSSFAFGLNYIVA